MVALPVYDPSSKERMFRSVGDPAPVPNSHGRPKEFRALVDAHGASVDGLLRGLERDPATREELWSDVFMVAHTRLDDLIDLSPGRQRGWFLLTTRNVVANSARRASTRRRALQRLRCEPVRVCSSAEQVFMDAAIEEDTSRRIAAAWRTLSGTHQEVLSLNANGLDGREIADRLGITHQSARSRLMRARRTFLNSYRMTDPS